MYGLCQKAFHRLFRLSLCLRQLCFKINRVQIQSAEHHEGIGKHRFIQIPDIACQNLRIEIEELKAAEAYQTAAEVSKTETTISQRESSIATELNTIDNAQKEIDEYSARIDLAAQEISDLREEQ